MRKLFLGIIAFFCAVIIITSCKPNKVKIKPIAMEDFFKNPEKTSYQISPDGTKYSYKSPFKDRMNVFVQEIGKDEAVQVTFEEARDVSGYFWANDNRIMFLKDVGGDENFQLWGVNTDGSDMKDLVAFDGVRTQIIDDLEDIPDYIIIGMNKRNPQVFDPYRLNINTGEMEMLAENPGNYMGWMTDHNGKLRVAIASDGINTQLFYRKTEQDEFQNILTTNFKETMNPVFFTFDNQKLYSLSNLGRDKLEAVIFNPETAKEEEVLYKNSEVDLSGFSYSRKRKVLTTATYVTDKVQKHFFDKESEEIYNRLNKDLGEYEVSVGSSNKEEDKFIIRTYSDRSRGAYYFYDKKSDELSKITEVSPWLNEKDMAAQLPIKYEARDGLTINGYLTLPVGYTMKTAKNLPVVVNPHGGPWARDYWGFNPEVQYMANKGFAVLQMNFRGSTTYGKEFWEKSFKQWGKTMQDDITDGVKWLIDLGIADSEKIGIYGGSYGGYATLAGLTFTPDIYACGVDYVGVSNMFTFMNTIPPYWEPFKKMMYEMVGDPKKDSALLVEVSPVFHVDKIKAPLFIAQGRNDPRVNVDESDQIVAAMKERGIEVEYLVKDDEGHGFRNEENRFDFYRAMGAFLDKHLKDTKK